MTGVQTCALPILLTVAEPPEPEKEAESATVPEGCEGVSSPLTANVFQIAVKPGDVVAEDQKLIVLDAMKTEIAIGSPMNGTVEQIHCEVGAVINAGQLLVSIRPS